jgi:hypothetical protein
MHLNDTSHEAGRVLHDQIQSATNIEELIFNRIKADATHSWDSTFTTLDENNVICYQIMFAPFGGRWVRWK